MIAALAGASITGVAWAQEDEAPAQAAPAAEQPTEEPAAEPGAAQPQHEEAQPALKPEAEEQAEQPTAGHEEAPAAADHEAQPQQPAAVAAPQAGQAAAAPSGELELEPDPQMAADVEQLGPGVDPKKYAAMLRSVISKNREKVLAKIDSKYEKAQEQRIGRISTALSWFSLSGLLLLWMPLFLIRRYPGRFWTLVKYSALASVTFIITTQLFANLLLIMRSAQGAVASITNPQRNIAEAVFDVLEKQADELVEIGPALLQTPLQRLASGEEDSLVAAIMNNVQSISAQAAVFKKIAGWFQHITGLLGYLPTVLTLLALVAFVIAMKPVLAKIVRLPIEAAEGRATGASVIKSVLKTLGWEIVITLIVVMLLLAVTITSAAMLSALIEPAVETLLAYVFLAIFYVLALQSGFKISLVYIAVVGALLFLVLNIVIVLVSSGAYLGKAQKLLRARFHDKLPFRKQWKFWAYGTLALIWTQSISIMFISIAKPMVENLVEWSLKGATNPADIHWPSLLASGPIILVVAFLLFWLCWGLKPLLYIMRFSVKPAEPAPAPVQQPFALPQPA